MKLLRIMWSAVKAKLPDLKPKDENDYYTVGPWMIGKKMAVILFLAVGAICLLYIRTIKPEDLGSGPYQAYRYSSAVLKWKSGKVRILGKSGYTAYVGEIEDGIVKGNGALYRPDGSMVYAGAFDGNKYNGQGKLYHANRSLMYEGEFRDNLYDGEGKLYREDRTLHYEGSFSGGSMTGNGKLYDGKEVLIFTGNFWNGSILYQDFIGKSTEEAAKMYTGANVVYESDGGYCNYMSDIDAVYAVKEGADTLEGEWKIEGIYVLAPKIWLNGSETETIPQVREILGEPAYEGNTALSAEEELALNLAIESGQEEALQGSALLEVTTVFDDVFEITDYEKNYLVYVYQFDTGDMAYTFFCRDKNGEFSFYKIEG